MFYNTQESLTASEFNGTAIVVTEVDGRTSLLEIDDGMNFDSTIDPFAIGIVGNGCGVIEFSITQALIAWLICRVDQIAVVELFAFEIAFWQFGKLFFLTDFFNGTAAVQGELQLTAGLFLLSAFWTLFKVTFEAHQGVTPRIQKEKRLLLNILFK